LTAFQVLNKEEFLEMLKVVDGEIMREREEKT
jgi:hypothetical protein